MLQGDGTGGSGELNVVMLVMMIGVAGVITAHLAGRARIVRERSIRRFRDQLRSADVVGLCRQRVADHRGLPEGQDPSPPGQRGHKPLP